MPSTPIQRIQNTRRAIAAIKKQLDTLLPPATIIPQPVNLPYNNLVTYTHNHRCFDDAYIIFHEHGRRSTYSYSERQDAFDRFATALRQAPNPTDSTRDKLEECISELHALAVAPYNPNKTKTRSIIQSPEHTADPLASYHLDTHTPPKQKNHSLRSTHKTIQQPRWEKYHIKQNTTEIDKHHRRELSPELQTNVAYTEYQPHPLADPSATYRVDTHTPPTGIEKQFQSIRKLVSTPRWMRHAVTRRTRAIHPSSKLPPELQTNVAYTEYQPSPIATLNEMDMHTPPGLQNNVDDIAAPASKIVEHKPDCLINPDVFLRPPVWQRCSIPTPLDHMRAALREDRPSGVSLPSTSLSRPPEQAGFAEPGANPPKMSLAKTKVFMPETSALSMLGFNLENPLDINAPLRQALRLAIQEKRQKPQQHTGFRKILNGLGKNVLWPDDPEPGGVETRTTEQLMGFYQYNAINSTPYEKKSSRDHVLKKTSVGYWVDTRALGTIITKRDIENQLALVVNGERTLELQPANDYIDKMPSSAAL